MKKNLLLSGIIPVIAAAGIFAFGIRANAWQVEGTTPLYSFYNEAEHDHFLTASSEEKEALQKNYNPSHPYMLEGTAWRVETRESRDNVPVYRFFNDVTKDHFYTISEDEKAALARTLADGTDHYVYEGIAWYAHSGGGTPVYRLFNPVTFDHYYTTDSSSKDIMVSTRGYNYEGIAWYEQQTNSTSGYDEGYNNGYNSGYNSGYNDGSNRQGNSVYDVDGPVYYEEDYSGQGYSVDTIVALLNDYLAQYDTHYIQPDYGESGCFIRVALYGNHTQPWYTISNEDAREPENDELWCYLSAAAGDGVMPIGNVYVNRYTGYVDATAVPHWNGADIPHAFYLW